MSQELTQLHLPVDIYSPEQSSTLLMELHEYTAALQDAVIKAKVDTKATKTAPEMSELLASLVHSCEVAVDDATALDGLYRNLQTALKAAPTMHITLSALPGRTLKRRLTVWFRTQVHPLSLLTFTARSDIGGGIILQAGSHLYDHSFRQQILANPKRIGELAGV